MSLSGPALRRGGAVLGALIFAGAEGLAQPAPRDAGVVADGGSLAEADAAFRDGMGAFRRGEYQRAADLFRRANAIRPHPDTRFNLGRALEELGDDGVPEAIEIYAQLLEVTLMPDARVIAQRLDALRRRPVRLMVSSTPVGASVAIDDSPPLINCPTPCPTRVAPGEHVVVIRLDGYEPAVERLRIQPGVRAEVQPVLRPLPAVVRAPPPPPPPPGPPTNDDRIRARRANRVVSGRLSILGGVGLPSDMNAAFGLEVGLFVRRSLTLQAHVLVINDTGVPTMATLEAGWTFLIDEIDLSALLHAGFLFNCGACRGDLTSEENAQFIGGLTARVDYFILPRLPVGLFFRASWRNFDPRSTEGLVLSFGAALSLHL